jgi:flagellum-specific ATP synthase
MTEITSAEHREAAGIVRELLAAYRDHEDLISIGAYRRGANRAVDLAMEMLEGMHQFLRQKVEEKSSVELARDALLQLRQRCIQKAKANAPAP